MKYYHFLIVLLFINCQPSSQKSSEEAALSIAEPKIDLKDSVIEWGISEETPHPSSQATIVEVNSNSKSILVDRVHYFPSTKEPYVWVGFKDGFDWKAMDTLKRYADSVIFKDEEITRTRYPIDKANEYLDLELLDSITIFNYSHQVQGMSRIKRVEFYEDVLGDQFIAVLQTNEDLTGDRFYGISGTQEFVSGLSSKEINDQYLKSSVKKHVSLPSKYDWIFSSTEVDPYNVTYSFYSFVAEGEKEKSFLIEMNKSTKGMKTMAEPTYSIWGLTPVPIQINNRPVLLLWVGYPETDAEWFTPTVFDGTKFQITNNRKINPSEFKLNKESVVD